MGNNTCWCKDDKELQNRDSDMASNSKRSTRRREKKEKRSSINVKKETVYENKGHTTNIITTNAAILYNGDKAQDLVREIMTSNIPPVKYPNIESEKNVNILNLFNENLKYIWLASLYFNRNYIFIDLQTVSKWTRGTIETEWWWWISNRRNSKTKQK